MSNKSTPSQVIRNLFKFIFTINEEFDGDHNIGKHYLNWIFKKNGWGLHNPIGNFSEVYTSPCEQYVLKVNIKTDSYPLYARWAMNNHNNPYAPNIYWHEAMLDVKGNAYIKHVTLMEKLEDMDWDIFQADPEVYDIYTQARNVQSITGSRIKAIQLQTENIFLEKIICILQSIQANDFMASMDLIKKDNFMLRGKQVVITDPIAF